MVASTSVARNVLSGSSTTKIAPKVSAMTAEIHQATYLRAGGGRSRRRARRRPGGRGRGGADDVVVLRLRVDDHPVVPGELDRDSGAADVDRGHLAVEGVLADGVLAQADGGGLPEDASRGPAAARLGCDQRRRVWAGRPFFIRIGVSQASSAPASSSAAITVRPHPRVEVVDVGLDEQQVVRPSRTRLTGLADEEPQHVGVALRVAAAGADADRVGGHRRLRAPGRRERGQQRGAGRRAQLHRRRAGRAGVRRDAAEQLGDRGRRDRQGAVGAADRAGADRDGRDHDLVGAEVGEARRRRRPRRRSRRARRPRGSARRAGRCRARWPRRRRAARRRAAPGRGPPRRARPRASRARMSRQVRWWTESATSTWQRVAAKPLRVTGSTRSVDRLGGDRVDGGLEGLDAGRRRRAARRAACRRWRRRRRRPRGWSSAPLCGRPAPRTRRRRSRCRC